MGKARKHSRAKSSGFVPDYMQADEFVCSGRIDSQMKHLDESPPLKRSCFGLNGDTQSVHKEVLSLSKISRSERKNLFHKLKMELQQVRDLSKKIASFGSDTVMLSPYNDVQSCSDGPRRLPPKNFATSVGSQGKKRPPVRNDKQRGKKGPSRLHVPTSSTVASVMKECETLLNRLWSHKFGWPFRTPVDPVMLNIPDYFTVIKHPMDLGTIRSRLRNGEYSSPLNFAADARLTFSNSMAYNPPGNQFHGMAQGLSKYFESAWKTIEKKIPVTETPVIHLTSSASLESEIPYEVEPAKLVMTDAEKKKLSQDLVALEEDIPQNLVDLLSEQSGSDGQSGELEIEIDIEKLSNEILFMVRKLLDDFLREKKKSQEKSEPCEMEMVHDSGFSDSPLQPSKGDPKINEDVDIVGGNDPSVSSHHPLKIEKDAACRNNECSSSSSSSSESGSSSSDSGSCSSSGSETDSIKASNPTSREDKKQPGVGINRKDDVNNSDENVVNDSLNVLGQLEHGAGEKSTAMDAVDVFPDEETAPPERQISPEKRYRAALLKNRFADTIMKAREKALTKGEKGDPEKLRREREEFEKRLREEKVRLEAEAKAAEEDRRKAKAQAAEKLRREREQEREAARQAIQKIEKTVEINEGRRFMEDLEMLRATSADGDQLPTLMEEMSPKLSRDMLGSFKMEGNNNPLEQLGLYMKMDDDEDEDEEGQPQFSQVEVEEEHTLDRSEGHTLNPHKEEGEDQLVSGHEEAGSQKTQDNGNQEDEKPISQNKREEQVENTTEQESRVVDMGEQETEGFEMGEQEHVVVDNEMQETEVVEKGEEETEVVDMMREQETEVVGMEEEETEGIDKGNEKIEVVDMRQQETEVVDKGGEETEVVDKEGKEETEAIEKGNEEVDKRDEESEVVGKGEGETVVVDKGMQEIEVVDLGVQGNEVVNKGGGEETEIVDKGVQETEDSDVEID